MDFRYRFWSIEIIIPHDWKSKKEMIWSKKKMNTICIQTKKLMYSVNTNLEWSIIDFFEQRTSVRTVGHFRLIFCLLLMDLFSITNKIYPIGYWNSSCVYCRICNTFSIFAALHSSLVVKYINQRAKLVVVAAAIVAFFCFI